MTRPSSPAPMRMVDLGYLAGIIDGEGCIHLKRDGGKQRLAISVGMTDVDVLQRCQTISQVGSIYGPQVYPNRKPRWVWLVGRQRDVAALLMTIYPLLSGRRQARALEVLALWRRSTRKEPEPYGAPGENGCGTYAGWAAHYRRGESPCRPCKDARNEYRRHQRAGSAG